MESDRSDKCAYPALCRVWLILDAFFCQVFVVYDDRFRNVAVAQVNDGWSTKQGRRLLIPRVYCPECSLRWHQ